MQKNNRNKKNNAPAIDLTAGYVQPQAIDIERAVLGSMLENANTIMEVRHLLKAADFHNTAHQLTFTSIMELYEKGIIPDILLVHQNLSAKGEGQTITPFVLAGLTKDVVTTTNVRRHCLIVKQKSIARKLLQISVKAATGSLDETTDIFEVIHELERELEAIQNELMSKKRVTLEDLAFKTMHEFTERVMLAREGKEDPNHVYTGMAEWDRMNGNLFMGGIYVLAARPGEGKTAMVMELIKRITAKRPAGFFNLEMTGTQIVKRLACNHARLNNDYWKKEPKYVTDHELHELNDAVTAMYQDLNVHIDFDGNIDNMRNTIRYWKAVYGVRTIFIDYLQICSVSDEVGKYMSDTERINHILEKLRHIALEQEICIILLSQLNRDGIKSGSAKKEPNLSHLKGSGKIEEIAYQVALLYRPEYHGILEDEDGLSTKGLAYLIIAKHRDGPVGRVKFKFTPEYSAFDNWVDPMAEVGWEPKVAPTYSQMGMPMKDDEEVTPF